MYSSMHTWVKTRRAGSAGCRACYSHKWQRASIASQHCWLTMTEHNSQTCRDLDAAICSILRLSIMAAPGCYHDNTAAPAASSMVMQKCDEPLLQLPTASDADFPTFFVRSALMTELLPTLG